MTRFDSTVVDIEFQDGMGPILWAIDKGLSDLSTHDINIRRIASVLFPGSTVLEKEHWRLYNLTNTVHLPVQYAADTTKSFSHHLSSQRHSSYAAVQWLVWSKKKKTYQKINWKNIIKNKRINILIFCWKARKIVVQYTWEQANGLKDTLISNTVRVWSIELL